jgi:calcineurin-like phosphoesterase family protein
VKFRDDIDPAKTWVVSDTHFGHENIVGYCLRPEDHEQAMIAEWRAEVPDDATVLHLGDLAWRSNARFKHIIAPELTGQRKLIILGNHDKQRFSFYKSSGFNIVRPFAIGVSPLADDSIYAIDDVRTPPQSKWVVSFSHYAWNEEEEGPLSERDLRLHGHIHNSGYTEKGKPYVPFLKQHVNMSVEQTHYRPVNLKLLLEAVLLGRLP